MRTPRRWPALAVGLLAMVLVGGTATASSDPLTGTWHQRDFGSSNIFYFVDAPVGGVFPVVFYDDATGGAVCGDNGPMMWAGFFQKTGANTYEGSFGNVWCPDNGDGVVENPAFSPDGVVITYDPLSDTISGGIGECEGTRQPSITSVAKAIHELEKGTYPAPVPLPAPGC